MNENNNTDNAQITADHIKDVGDHVLYAKTISDQEYETEVSIYKNLGQYYIIVDDDIKSMTADLKQLVNRLVFVIERVFYSKDIKTISFIQSDNDKLPDYFDWDRIYDQIDEFEDQYN